MHIYLNVYYLIITIYYNDNFTTVILNNERDGEPDCNV